MINITGDTSNNVYAMAVVQLMTPEPVVINRYRTIYDAYLMMKSVKIKRLPVIDKDILVGILSYSDIFEARLLNSQKEVALWEVSYLASRMIVDFIMTKNPLCIYRNDTVGHAAGLMQDNQIGALPVLDESDKVTGLITKSDIFRKIFNIWREQEISR